MKFTRTIKDKLLVEIASKKNSRGDTKYFHSNFIKNFSRSYELFNYVKENNKDEEIRRTALAQHIISLVSICETFLRDIFTFIVKIDNQFKEEVMTLYNLKIKTAVPNTQLEIEDVLCEFFNFQDVDDIEYAFKPIISGINFFEDIGDVVLPFYNHQKDEIQKFCLNISISNWKELFGEIIRERHNITHDANYITSLEVDSFGRYQKVILYFPQVFSFWINAKYNLPYIALTIKDKGTIPYVFQLEDITAEWELVDD